VNDEKLIWESYLEIFSEADTIGRAYRMAKKGSESSNKGFTAREFYNYIKDAQQKARERLKHSKEKNSPITVFHMINYNRLGRDKDKLISAAQYLLSKKDEEISVSMDTQPWEVRDSIILVGNVKDLYEVYDADTYTKDSKERFPLDIRKAEQMDWDEVIINLRDVDWEYFYDNIHVREVNDFLSSKDLRQIYSHEELMGHFSDSPRAIKQMDIDEDYKKLSEELYDKYVLMNNFYEFLQGNQSNADIIRNSKSFENILDLIKPLDEYSMTELSIHRYDPNSQYNSEDIENVIPRTELGKRIGEEDILNLKNEINNLVDIQMKVNDAWDDLVNEIRNSGMEEEAFKIERSKNLGRFTESGHLNKY
jgi:hypothetical protein